MSDPYDDYDYESGFIYSLYFLGTMLAVALSWSVNHSVLWAIIHSLFSWLYIIYYVV